MKLNGDCNLSKGLNDHYCQNWNTERKGSPISFGFLSVFSIRL